MTERQQLVDHWYSEFEEAIRWSEGVEIPRHEAIHRFGIDPLSIHVPALWVETDGDITVVVSPYDIRSIPPGVLLVRTVADEWADWPNLIANVPDGVDPDQRLLVFAPIRVECHECGQEFESGPYIVQCTACDGAGRVDGEPCLHCNASGWKREHWEDQVCLACWERSYESEAAE